MASGRVRRIARFVFLSDGAPCVRGLAAAAASRYAWRVTAANNRPLGGSVQALASFEECLAAARRVHSGARLATRSVAFDTERGYWTWTLEIGGRRTAACARPYLRRFECVRGLEHFVSSAEVARPDDAAVRHLGAHFGTAEERNFGILGRRA